MAMTVMLCHCSRSRSSSAAVVMRPVSGVMWNRASGSDWGSMENLRMRGTERERERERKDTYREKQRDKTDRQTQREREREREREIRQRKITQREKTER